MELLLPVAFLRIHSHYKTSNTWRSFAERLELDMFMFLLLLGMLKQLDFSYAPRPQFIISSIGLGASMALSVDQPSFKRCLLVLLFSAIVCLH